jgi:hypothetical protein
VPQPRVPVTRVFLVTTRRKPESKRTETKNRLWQLKEVLLCRALEPARMLAAMNALSDLLGLIARAGIVVGAVAVVLYWLGLIG